MGEATEVADADVLRPGRRLEQRSRRELARPGLPVLGRVVEEEPQPRAERGGKPRRIVTPTRDGVAAVRATMTAITAMTRGVKI